MFSSMNLESNTEHIPVMLNEVIFHLANNSIENKLVVDCTFGAGGYTREFLKRGARVIALDRDINAIEMGKKLQQEFPNKLKLIHTNFGRLNELELDTPDIIIMDIGVSSMQIDQAERGFSFQKNGPLDMRMGCNEKTAAYVVNNYDIEDLIKIFRFYGEEKHARKIAKMIVTQRTNKAFITTIDLSNAIENIIPKRHFEKIHPATRVFQALRIYINDELGELYKILHSAEQILPSGGKLGVVSFHSLEDKIVKNFLKSRSQAKAVSRYMPEFQAYLPSFHLPIKKAIKPQIEECLSNKRARSAKFRFAIRNNLPPLKDKEILYKTL